MWGDRQLTPLSVGGQEYRVEGHVRMPLRPLSSCVALGMLLNFSEPH